MGIERIAREDGREEAESSSSSELFSGFRFLASLWFFAKEPRRATFCAALAIGSLSFFWNYLTRNYVMTYQKTV